MLSWVRLTAAALVMTGASLVSGVASAQTFTFAGSATGGFTTNGGSMVDKGLTYAGSTFNVTSSMGFATIGSDPGSPNTNNLGSFALDGTGASYTGDVFRLVVTFSAPAGTTANTPASGVYTSVLVGNVANTANGGVQLTFVPISTGFTFPGGAFSLFVNSTSVTPGRTVAVTGYILAVATPGPVAGAGIPALVALAGLAFYRRRQNARTA